MVAALLGLLVASTAPALVFAGGLDDPGGPGATGAGTGETSTAETGDESLALVTTGLWQGPALLRSWFVAVLARRLAFLG
jgi:hypothetical protein